MKTSQAITTILTLGTVILAASSHGQTLLYDNGPVNGTGNQYSIAGPFFVTDSFTLGAASTVTNATVGIWNLPGDSLTSLQWSITTGPNSGTTLATGTSATIDTFLRLGTGGDAGAPVYSDSFSITPTALAAGTYWLQLSGAVTGANQNAYWDVNNGPSSAYQGISGSIDTPKLSSESFQLYGTITSAPEPSTMALVVVGSLSLLGFRRRK